MKELEKHEVEQTEEKDALEELFATLPYIELI